MQNLRDDPLPPPGEDYFNDLSQQQAVSREAGDRNNDSAQAASNKTKRCAACTLCRKRKLKCDGAKPACSTCSRLKHDCSYDEVRKKSGPKRGYVKLLEARLAQVETLLKKDDAPGVTSLNRSEAAPVGNDERMVEYEERAPPQQQQQQQDFPAQISHLTQSTSTPDFFVDGNAFSEETYPWELISLGLDEPLPIQPVVDELNQIYFEKFHPSLPMIHRPRFHAAMHLAPHTRPPVCLRYAMWCNAAAMVDKFDALQEHFYHRARKYIQQDEMKGHGESMLTIAHVQTWVLLGTYEFKKMYFPRAWMSSGRASRMALMMGLNRLDASGLQVKQCLPPVRDWTEQEERKRTFWSAFCVDRYSSIGTGWPMSIEEQDIHTRMPGTDEAFDLSKPEPTSFLPEALEPSGAGNLSSFGGVVLMACLFGRNLTHLHRPSSNDQDDDLNGAFWRRHRDLDSLLLNISLSLPDRLRLPMGLGNSNVIFLSMNIHTSTICLHQAAIFKADTHKNRIPARISAESKVRCITAAAETASIMRTISHLDLSTMNPFISFCLYVAARVFVQYLRSRPQDHQIGSSLQFLLSAMHAIKRKNPLTESFLIQLDVDLESAGLESLRLQQKHRPTPTNQNSQSCVSGGLAAATSAAGESGGGSGGTGRPTYGDQGLAAFSNPSQQNGGMLDMRSKNTTFVATIAGGANDNSDFSGMQFGLPTRQRSTPGVFIFEMDTSPDDASGNDQQGGGGGSGSSVQNNNLGGGGSSTRTPSSSATTYSPLQQVDPMFEPGGYTAQPGVRLQGVHQPGGAFIAPHDWGDDGSAPPPQDVGVQGVPDILAGTGFGTLSGSGGGGGELGDVMAGMSDAEWNSVLESMGGWDSGLDQGAMNLL